MPAPTTTDEFIELVRKSNLADPQLLESVLEELRASAFPTEPKKLALALVRKGLLTYFYAEQILRGVWRGFHIGKYRILERIGSGGMGIVYLGEHKLMGNRVAIKVLPLALASHPWFIKRFYREAQAVAALNHPNIVRAHDIDQDGNLHFLVMEYVDGSSLQEITGKFGPMNPVRACHYVSQAALGLEHIHEVGLVHRDIKPGNLLLDRSGMIRILDLGLARFFRDNQKEAIPVKTTERTMVGTDDYLAPEQIVNSDEADIRADIYSLGATFYFLLTGSSPFESEALAYQKLLKHLARSPRPIRELCPQVPQELASLVEKMMAKNPWERFQVPSRVVEALASWTQVPIARPPVEEMPRLCPAIERVAVPAENAVVASVAAKAGGSSSRFQFDIQGSGSGVFSDRLRSAQPQPPTPNPSLTNPSTDTVKDPPASGTSSGPPAR
jgi:serine/threonine protein kinase